jgi:hypothetical protein
MKGIGYLKSYKFFENFLDFLGNFLGEFFWRNFFGGMLGRNFLGGFFGGGIL